MHVSEITGCGCCGRIQCTGCGDNIPGTDIVAENGDEMQCWWCFTSEYNTIMCKKCGKGARYFYTDESQEVGLLCLSCAEEIGAVVVTQAQK